MGSNSKQTKAIRRVKAKPNRKNLKKNLERVQKNAAILRELASESEANPSWQIKLFRLKADSFFTKLNWLPTA